MKLTSSWFHVGTRRRSSLITGIGVITCILLGNALDGSLRALYRIQPYTKHGRSLLFPNHDSIIISHDSPNVPIHDPYLEAMMNDKRLVRSAQHQSKFFRRRNLINDTLHMYFPRHVLFPTATTWWAAYNINADWGYVHVWKSGGTTIEVQTKEPQVSVQDIQNRSKWMAFVRDPIDHFLAGYSECAFRTFVKRRVSELPAWNPADYDRRIQTWLQEVQETTLFDKIDCHIHSFPQANFLIDKDTSQFYPKIRAIGDMHELPAFLGTIAKFPYNHTQGSSNVAKDNHVKINYFPSRRDLLSEKTLQDICRFVSLDYYFFDFDPPPVCKTDGILVVPQQQTPLYQQLPFLQHYSSLSFVKQPPQSRSPGLVSLAKFHAQKQQRLQNAKDQKRLDHQQIHLQQLLLQRERQQGTRRTEQLDRQQTLLEERLTKVKEAKEKLLLKEELQQP